MSVTTAIPNSVSGREGLELNRAFAHEKLKSTLPPYQQGISAFRNMIHFNHKNMSILIVKRLQHGFKVNRLADKENLLLTTILHNPTRSRRSWVRIPSGVRIFCEFPMGSINISFLMCIYHSHIRSLGLTWVVGWPHLRYALR